MARTAEEISRTIRARLKVLDPDISAEPLTVERKIIDTVAETVAEAEIDQFVLQYQYDIDTKVGDDLDRFASLFGFGRMRGRRAVGTITFSRTADAERDIVIPAGSQVIRPATSVTPAIIFYTTSTVTLFQGTTSVSAPIEALEAGELGNVPANSITSLGVADAINISEVTNAAATTGGANPETDAEFRVRFKNMIFRNVAGTHDQFLALAIASRFSKKANVVGPISRFSEYIQVPSASPFNTNTQNTYAKYIFPFDYYLTDGNPGEEIFFSPTADYTFAQNNAVSPATGTITAVIVSTTLSVGYTFPLPSSALNGSITNVQTTITLDSVSGFPTSYPFWVSIDAELIRVDSLASGTTYNVTRAQDGTAGAAHNDDASVRQAMQVASTAALGTRGSVRVGPTGSTTTLEYLAKSTNYLLGVSGGSGTYGSGSVVTQGNLAPGLTYLFEHSYTSISSRNDPANNVANYVDVYVSGQDIRDVLESCKFPGTGNNVVNDPNSAFHQTKYVRNGTTTNPTLGNRLFFPLWQPVYDIPATLVINGVTYTEGTHYYHIKDNTIYQNSRRARDGIEFTTATASAIVIGTEFMLDYDFDRLPLTLNELMDTYKQITSDVLVHGAQERYFKVNLVIMYESGFAPATVDVLISSALTDFLEEQNFGTMIQLADIVSVVSNVEGVDAVRVSRSTDDATFYGIQEVDALGTPIGIPQTTDFRLQDDELPVLHSVKTIRKAQNTWQF